MDACDARISTDLACIDVAIIQAGRALIPERVSSNPIKICAETTEIQAFLMAIIGLMKMMCIFGPLCRERSNQCV